MPRRWVVLSTPWYQCFLEGIPFLAEPDDETLIVPPEIYRPEPRDIVMAPHRAPELAPAIRDSGATPYEAENLLTRESPWRDVSMRMRDVIGRPWLNYSAANAAAVGDIPHPPRLRSVHQRAATDRPTDVLFVGSSHPRRDAIVRQLIAAGVTVEWPIAFEAKLREAYERARVLINVHYYTPGVFECFRVLPALAAGLPVISETSERGEGEELCTCAPYEDLVSTVRAHLGESCAST